MAGRAAAGEIGGKLLWSDGDCFDSVNGTSMAPIKRGLSFSFMHFLGGRLEGRAGYHLNVSELMRVKYLRHQNNTSSNLTLKRPLNETAAATR